MNIGIIGTGNVGSALASGVAAAGHDVVLGSREPDVVGGHEAEVTTQREAAEHGEIVISRCLLAPWLMSQPNCETLSRTSQ